MSTSALRVVSGSPTPEELAVVTALVVGAGSGSAPEAPAPAGGRGRWADPKWCHRGGWLPGAGAWRTSLR